MRAERVSASGLRLAYLQDIQDPKQVRDNGLTRRAVVSVVPQESPALPQESPALPQESPALP